MSQTPINSSDLHPVYVAQPDMRFGTTFLSHEYRDYAVNGESLVDKSSGELFIKRPIDGRVVSFFQNKKYLDELMFELRILMNSNADYVIPSEDDSSTYFLSLNYDIPCINNEQLIDIITSDIAIDNDSTEPINKLLFSISSKSNGFFIRLTSRDCDKAIISLLTGEHNRLISGYTGNNMALNTAKAELENNVGVWNSYNADVNFGLVVERKSTSRTYSYNFQSTAVINEETFVKIPDEIMNEIKDDIKSITVMINYVDFSKLRLVYNNAATLSSTFKEEVDRIIYPDNKIYINYINIMGFIDKSSDIKSNGNEFVLAMIDTPECYRILNKMSKLKDSASFFLSVDRPNPTVWNINGIWAENLREVKAKGETIDNNTEFTFEDLEKHLAENDGRVEAYISDDPTDPEAYYLCPFGVKTTYSTEEVDELIKGFNMQMREAAQNIIADNPDEVTTNGMVFEEV